MARYAGTEAALRRVLARKVDRWARTAEGDAEDVAEAMRRARAAIPGVVERLRQSGVLNDAAFAEARARRLTRAGKSRRATMAHLAAKGVGGASLPEDPERELAAACAYLRRRRGGAFGDALEPKLLAAMARGGFAEAVARKALRMARDEAEALIKSLNE
jgi:regulatory protein